MKRICDFFSQEELDGIKDAVRQAELLTSGEIKVVIRCGCEQGLSTREQVFRDFYRHGLNKTKGQTGVLILILLKEKKVEVLGDKGINDNVPDGYWQGVVKTITDGFGEGKRYDGIYKAVVDVGRLLREKFPRQPDDVNELPNEVVQG